MLLFLALFLTLLGNSQAQTSLQFTPLFHHSPLQLDSLYQLGDSNHTTQISQLKFYLGNIELWQDEQLVYNLPTTYYLMDAEQPNSLQLELHLPKDISYNQLKFWVGVDSLTNAQGVQGGALDPMQGMYWTWQSGYINFKLEGTSTFCTSRGQEFQFHIGGFQAPYYPLQKIALPVQQGENLQVGLEIDQLLLKTNLKDKDHIMSPNQKALDFAQLFPLVFFMVTN